MSEAEYDAARAKIAPDKAQAVVRWEQELATLFYRSGWTQQELAKKEGKDQKTVSRLVVFGRFLTFTADRPVGLNLTERRFRTYWDRTSEHGNANERVRFRAVLELIEAEEPLRQSHVAKGYPKRIVEQFADGKWHALPRSMVLDVVTYRQPPGPGDQSSNPGHDPFDAWKRR